MNPLVNPNETQRKPKPKALLPGTCYLLNSPTAFPKKNDGDFRCFVT